MTTRLNERIRKLLEKWKPDRGPVDWFQPDYVPLRPRPRRERKAKERNQ